jgi:hypothetical protein
MSLAVPEILSQTTSASQGRGYYNQAAAAATETVASATDELTVKFDSARHEILFEEQQVSPVFKGDWIVLSSESKNIYLVQWILLTEHSSTTL